MPEDYGSLYQAAGQTWNVSPLLLQAMAGAESSEDPNAVGPRTRSGQQAQGMMQFMPGTAEQYGVQPFEPPSAIYGAANYMRDLLDRHRGDTRAALAEYNHSHPNSDYVNQVMGRFFGLTNAWGMTESAKNFQTPPQAPNTLDAEGKFPAWAQAQPQAAAAQPAPGAYTLVPHAPAEPAAPAAQPAASYTLVPYAPETGAAEAPRQGQQYVSTGTSPGAKAVGQPIAEDRVPGPGFQALINTPTDPLQRARVAAHQLGVPLDNIIMGPEGRMAAVDKGGGTPYYIEPEKVTAYHDPQTRFGPPGTPYEADPFNINPYQRPFVPLEAASASGTSPARPDVLSAALKDPGNMLRAGGALVPGTIQNALVAAPAGIAEAALGPAAGATAAGLATGLTAAGRQFLANTMDPGEGRPVFTGDTAKDMLTAGVGWRVGSGLMPATLARGGIGPPPGEVGPGGISAIPTRGLFAPGPNDLIGRSGFAPPYGNQSIPITRQEPMGLQGRIAPWEEARRWELPPNPPPGTPPSMPVPGAGRPVPGSAGAGGVHLNPMGEAAEGSGPYAPTSAGEARAQEVALSTLPPQRLPLVTQSQVEARADQIYRHMASNGNLEADTRDLVPGSPATMGGRTGNAGLNALERWLRNEPELKNTFDAIDARQHGARSSFASRLIGNPDELEALQTARDAQTRQLREQAFANTAPTDPAPAVAEIDRVLAGPEGKREGVSAPLRRLRDSFYTTDAEGKRVLESNPEMLYGVRKNITDALSPMARGTERDASTASALLQNVLGKLDAAIEAGAPGFRGYMDAFSQASRPIDAMEYLLRRNMTDATTGAPTLAKVDQTIKDIERRRLMPGTNDAKSVSDEQFVGLTALRDDLRRSANLGKGKALGSNTAENFAGGSYLNSLTGPVAHTIGRGVGGYLGSWPGYFAAQGAEGLLGGVGARASVRLKEALLRRVFNEGDAGVRALQGNAAGAPPIPGPPMGYTMPQPGPPPGPPPRRVPPPLAVPPPGAGPAP